MGVITCDVVGKFSHDPGLEDIMVELGVHRDEFTWGSSHLLQDRHWYHHGRVYLCAESPSDVAELFEQLTFLLLTVFNSNIYRLSGVIRM